MRLAWERWVQGFRSAVPAEKRLSKDAVMSIVLHGLFQFGASMSGVFLTLYLWRLTHSLYVSGMFNTIVFLVTPVGFALAGWFAKRKDRMVSYRIGIIGLVFFYLLVILSGEGVAKYYVLFAVLNAIAASFYWTAYLTLMYEVSTEHNRMRYLSFNMIAFTLAGLAGPALAGFIISRMEGLKGYMAVFAVAFVMFLLTTIGSLRIRSNHSHHRTYYLHMMLLPFRKNRNWRRSLFAYYVFATLQGLMIFLPNLMLYQAVPREDLVGYLGVLFSGLAILTGYGFGKWGNVSRSKLYLAVAAAGYTAGSLLLLWKQDIVTIVIFMVLYSSFNVVQGNSLTNYYYRLMGELPLKGALRIESIVMREAFVNAGRITAILLLLAVADNLTGRVLPMVLLAASLLQFVVIALAGGIGQPKRAE
ncbi:MFS transporter [Paenibacillus hamazuiensis]|uniref:MFS transporter n=1 Tax=Paenibacillus hamazuiensis TaxID=2936508 RepID=UPI00200F0F30|nr:MFS transporter [Paenibacillus hamazuiensis]